jgi:hypothetical protein
MIPDFILFTAPICPSRSYSTEGGEGGRLDSNHHAAFPRPRSRPDGESRAALAEQVRLRQAAAAFLRAASLTADVAERKSLRRKAAELLLRGVREEPRATQSVTRPQTRSTPPGPSAER